MRRYLHPINPLTGKLDTTITIWDSICTEQNIRVAHQCASRGKKWYDEVREYDKDPDRYTKQIVEMLKDRTYVPLPYHKFQRQEHGKLRDIYKSHYYPERVIQWGVTLVIDPIVQRQYTKNTYSAIKDRGIHRALTDVQSDLKKHPELKYALKFDIKKYYPSIDRDLLIEDYRHLFKDDGLLWYLETNIKTAPDTGILIGNYLSQTSGNFYLSPLDHLLKEDYGVDCTYRYMDDVVVLGETSAELHALKTDIFGYLAAERHLTVKPDYQVYPIDARGIDFVGYKIFPDYALLRKSTKLRMEKAMTKIADKVAAGVELTYSDFCRFGSYKGWLLPCNSHRLYDKYFRPLEGAIQHYYETQIKEGKSNAGV